MRELYYGSKQNDVEERKKSDKERDIIRFLSYNR